MALALLRQQEFDLIAVHAQLADITQPEVLEGLRENCGILDVPLQVLDLRSRFEELVVAPYVQSYLEGRTPNPCTWCNARIKFGLLLDAVRAQGARILATGHYACVTLTSHGPALWRGADQTKDQSYFLALLSPSQLAQAAFPLAEHRKQSVLPELNSLGLTPPLPGESQEVCFVSGDYRDFLEQRITDLPPSGPIVHENGRIIGKHTGLWRYTVGQRKGLDVAWNEPLYVLRKDTDSNRLVVGERALLLSPTCHLKSVNFLVPPTSWPQDLFLQTRYRQRPEPVRLSLGLDAIPSPDINRLTLSYPIPREPAASGQVGVLYSLAGQVLAAGEISS